MRGGGERGVSAAWEGEFCIDGVSDAVLYGKGEEYGDLAG